VAEPKQLFNGRAVAERSFLQNMPGAYADLSGIDTNLSESQRDHTGIEVGAQLDIAGVDTTALCRPRQAEPVPARDSRDHIGIIPRSA
jgi:hypothetical protein